MTRLDVPDALLAQARLGPHWARWLDGLPRLAEELLTEWGLSLDGAPVHGLCALVLPVRTSSRRPAVLKLHLPDAESEHEALALQHWAGNGAVQLLRADPRRYALLLERLHRDDLTDLWDLEACEVVAGLWQRIHVPAPPQLRPLTSLVERWTEELAQLPRSAPLPRRLVELAIGLGRELVRDEASIGTLVHTDLHYGNVLAGDREPWLVIDPKPVSGDPHYEVAPMLWNRFDELAGDVRGGLRRRFHTLVDAGGLDEDRARDWVVVRMVHNAMWRIAEAPARGDDGITTCIAIAKAVQG